MHSWLCEKEASRRFRAAVKGGDESENTHGLEGAETLSSANTAETTVWENPLRSCRADLEIILGASRSFVQSLIESPE